VQRVSADAQTDLSGKWNDTDAKLTSESLIKDCFSSAWLQSFQDEQGRKPAVRVRGVVNKTDEHIDSQVFIKNIERAMVNSGKVKVLAQEGSELSSVEKEQDRAASGAQSDETAVSLGNETGADYVVAVRVTSILDQVEGQKAKFYKVNFELISPSSGEKVWIGDHEIKKLIEQDSVSW
jgi:PBP1b-binding outer membrane lipoprotein LpoB